MSIGRPNLELRVPGGRQPLHVEYAQSEDAPVAVCLPALGIRASYYIGFLRELAGAGVHAVAADLTGHGTSPVRARRGREWGYGDLVAEHLPAIHAVVRRHFPRSSFFWAGHSLGGQLGLMHAGRSTDAVQGVVLVGSGCPYHRAWKAPACWALLGLSRLSVGIASVCGYFPGHRLGFGGREAKRLMHDWAAVVRTGSYRFDGIDGGVDGDQALEQLECPVLAIYLDGDRFAPGASVEHTLQRCGTREVSRWTWSSSPRPNHNRWPRNPAVPAATAADWILRQSTRSQPNAFARGES